jgi:hypothetical protein
MRTAYALRLGAAASLVLAFAACGPAREDPSAWPSAVSIHSVKPKHCLAAEPVDLSPGVVTIVGDSGRTSNRREWCGEGPGEYYAFTVGTLSALYVDTVGSSFDTVIGVLADGCGSPPRSCSDDACGTSQSQLMEILPAGTYQLLVAGRTTGDRGPYAVHLQLLPVPSLPAGEIPRGAFDLQGAITTFGGGEIGDCGRGPFVWYWYLSCPGDSGYFTASASSVGTPFFPALSFVDVDDGEAVCCSAWDPGGGCSEAPPGEASVQVWDEPEAGMHVLEVGATGIAHLPEEGLQFRVVGARP